jgi:hypothetical protein
LIWNEVGLWKDNIPFLLEYKRIRGMDVAMIPDMPTIHSEDASMVIIEALWREIRDQ